MGPTSIVLTPEHPPVAPEFPARWPVTGGTARSQAIGAQAKQPRACDGAVCELNTVQTHLAHVYEKLGV